MTLVNGPFIFGSVIRTFGDAETRRFWEEGRTRRLPAEIRNRAAMRLVQLDSATRLADLMRKKSIYAIHPGEFLAEILSDLKLSQAALARAVGVSPMRISHVIKGTRPVTAELALLFGRAFHQSPQYWLNLQARFDLTIAEASLGQRLSKVHAVTAA